VRLGTTYDSTVHFYDLSHTLSAARMMVCPEWTDDGAADDRAPIPLPPGAP